MQYYHPVKVEKVVIVPAWEEYKPEPGEVIVFMDPGMAFGTGMHETTQLMIKLLSSYVKPGDFVLDIGCGSVYRYVRQSLALLAPLHAILTLSLSKLLRKTYTKMA